MDLPNVLIVLLHLSSICMNRLDVDSAGSAVSKTVLCSLILGLKLIKTYDFSFSHFISCEFLIDDTESLKDI